MDSSDLAARQISALPPTHRSPSLHLSPSNTPHQATGAPPQSLVQPINEHTPIVNGSQRQRHYNSTENLKSQDAGLRYNGNGIARTRTQSSKVPSHHDLEPHPSWYARVADRYGSLELENKGSVARDHLALERTFLAWLRTSLAFASIGIAVTQLFRLSSSSTESADGVSISSPFLPSPSADSPILKLKNTSGHFHTTSASQHLRAIGKPLGTTFIGIAILILLMGFHRYFESQYWIIRGKFPASRGSIALVSFLTGALIVAALAVILATSSAAIEG